LVTVSIGVGFAITRTFGVTWTWLHIGDGNWAFDKDAFLQEMLPLVVVVPAMSLLAYFLITGAVRKYKAYLASGQDYNRLVKSIKKIEDLEDNRIKSLGDYPELRDFLLKIKKGINERAKTLADKEKALNARTEQSSAAERYQAEAGVLIGAINRGPADGFGEELALSLPELKNVEQAIRQHLLGATAVSMSPSDIGEQLANIKEELDESTTALNQMMSDISGEMVASQNGAREIEMYLNQLKTVTAAGAGSGPDTAATTALVDRLDQACAALATLGEETRSVAINTALQAGSGENDGTAVVKLADDVRDLAARFNGTAAQIQEVGQQLKAGVQSASSTGDTGQIDETIETLSGKVTFWVERAMVLSEKLNSFKQHYSEISTAFQAKIGGAHGEEPYRTVDDLSTDTTYATETAGAEEEVAPGTPDDFERQKTVSPLEPGKSTTPGLTGIEQDKNLFEEIGGNSEDNLVADIPSAQGQDQPAGPPPADTRANAPAAEPSSELFEEMSEVGGAQEEQPLAPPQSESRTEPGELVQSQVDLSGVEVEGTSVPGVEPPPADISLDGDPHSAGTPVEAVQAQVDPAAPASPQEESVISLYELGAVDYEPSVHQNA
jgi:hypothetical protein